MHLWFSFVFFLLLYSSGPCYLHSRLTSSGDFTCEMCNTTPRFTDEDNLCFRQGEGFCCGQYGDRAPAICPQTDLLAAKQPALIRTLAFSAFSSLSLSLGFVPALPTLYLIPYVYPCLHLKPPLPTLPPKILRSLLSSLSLWPNVGRQMKQLDFHLRLKEIDMCCSVSGRALCLSYALSQGREGQANQIPRTPHTRTGCRNSSFYCPYLLHSLSGKQ